MTSQPDYIIPFNKIDLRDIAQVGGKNASLGEMIQKLGSKGIRVPNGFATPALAYRDFLRENSLEPKLSQTLKKLDHKDFQNLDEIGKKNYNTISVR